MEWDRVDWDREEQGVPGKEKEEMKAMGSSGRKEEEKRRGKIYPHEPVILIPWNMSYLDYM